MIVHRRGFTLLELLLAMAITAITAGLLYAVMRAGFTAARVTADAAGDSRSLVLALDRIERAVASAPPPRGLLAGALIGDDQTVEGHDALSLHTVVDALGTEWGDIVGVSYELQAAPAAPASAPGEGLRLVELTTRNLLAPGEAPVETRVICADVATLNFRYFDGSGWFDSWDSTQLGNLLPVAVEVTLELREREVSQDGQSSGTSAQQTRQLTRLITLPCATGQEAAQ